MSLRFQIFNNLTTSPSTWELSNSTPNMRKRSPDSIRHIPQTCAHYSELIGQSWVLEKSLDEKTLIHTHKWLFVDDGILVCSPFHCLTDQINNNTNNNNGRRRRKTDRQKESKSAVPLLLYLLLGKNSTQVNLAGIEPVALNPRNPGTVYCTHAHKRARARTHTTHMPTN